TSVHCILKNETYTGTLVWGRSSRVDNEQTPVRVENAWESIVDRETFNRVQALLREKAPANFHPRRTASRYLLSGLARCGHCGKALVCQDAKSGKYSYYQCGTLLKQGAGSCDARYLNSKRFENLVIGKIKERILTEGNLRQLVGLVNEEMDATMKETRQRLDVVAAEIENVHRRLERLYDALETGKLELNDLAPRIQALRSQEDQLQGARLDLEDRLAQRKIRLADEEVVRGYIADLHDTLANSPLAEQKAFVRSFVKEVKVTGDEVLLTYTMPLSPEGVLQESAGVLDTVQYGGRCRT
ncbi:MAG: recombinase zinc beta ribbon domain-containing protein, partial [Dehalococcoidia bacterium]